MHVVEVSKLSAFSSEVFQLQTLQKVYSETKDSEERPESSQKCSIKVTERNLRLFRGKTSNTQTQVKQDQN